MNIFSLNTTAEGCDVLRNGRTVARRSTRLDAIACALRLKYLEDNRHHSKKVAKQLKHRHDRRRAKREIRETL